MASPFVRSLAVTAASTDLRGVKCSGGRCGARARLKSHLRATMVPAMDRVPQTVGVRRVLEHITPLIQFGYIKDARCGIPAMVEGFLRTSLSLSDSNRFHQAWLSSRHSLFSCFNLSSFLQLLCLETLVGVNRHCLFSSFPMLPTVLRNTTPPPTCESPESEWERPRPNKQPQICLQKHSLCTGAGGRLTLGETSSAIV